MTHSTADECTTCDEGYYLITLSITVKSCIKGSVSNCKSYETDKVNKCSLCSDGFYLSTDNKCKRHYYG